MLALLKILILIAIVGTGHACSPPKGWESQSVRKRAGVPEWIVYGMVVTDEMPAMEGGDIIQQSKVIVEPLCWLKRGTTESDTEGVDDSDIAAKFENITVLEEKACVANELIKGTKYIFFLGKGESSDQFTINDVNLQSGALEPTDENFEAVHRGIDASLEGDPEGECLDGVEIPCFTGEADPELCDLGVALKMTLQSVILGVALAALSAFLD